MGGTYRLYLDSIRSNSGWTDDADAAPAQAQIDRLNGDGAGSGIGFGFGAAIGTATIHFNLDTARIVLTGDVAGTFAQSGLPAGFAIVTKEIQGHLDRSASGASHYARFDELGFEECEVLTTDYVFYPPTPAGPAPLLCTKPVVSTLNTINSGVGLRAVIAATKFVDCIELRVQGLYEIRRWWWSYTLDAYVHAEADPGGDYVEVDYPTPRIDDLSPNDGPIAGGTAFTITGVGFYGPDGSPSVFGVFFDDFPATSVVVVDAQTITGVTPAHWAGGVPVIVSLDFEP
jgi:hypothetical protein